MADRYWVGGSAAWDTIAATKWATTSGGAGGASVPTSADNVFLDAASGAVTITVTSARPCLNLDCTGFTGTLAGTSTPNLQCYGNLTFSSGMTYSTASSPTITMLATTTGKTVTTAGKTLWNITFNGFGGAWTLQDEIVNSENITVTAGTFNTNNFNIKSSNIRSTGGSPRAINLGSSTAYAIFIWTMTSTGMTFTAGTSTVRCDITNDGGTFSGGGLTYYNVQIGRTDASYIQNIVGANTFNGTATLITSPNVAGYFLLNNSNTFNNLILQNNNVGAAQVRLAADQTINGAFTTSTTNATTRIYIYSSSVSLIRTITINGTTTLSDVDFQDITISGTASPISGTRLGDGTNNSGITFPAAKTVYWGLLSGSQNWEATGWATSSGGTPAINNFPLAQDTAVIDNSSTASTITGSTLFLVGTIDCSTRTSALTISITNKRIYGNVTLSSAITASSFSPLFYGNATQTFTTAGKTISAMNVIKNSSVGSTVSISGDLTLTTLTLTSGGFDAVSSNVTTSFFISSNSNPRSLSMGSGLWTLTGTGTVWDLDTTTSITFNKGTADILLSSTSTALRNFYSSGAAGSVLAYNKLTIGGTTGTATLYFSGSTTFTELASTKTVAHTIQIQAGRTLTVDTWSVKGTAGNIVTINSSASTSQASISITNKTTGIDYLAIQNINGLNVNPITFWAGANSTNTSNNTGIAFASGATTQAYILTSGTSFTTPVDWNNASNSIYLIGGGGGGSGSASNTTTNARAAGGGGGGGGFTLLTNQTLSGAISYAIGAAGSAGTGSGGAGARSSTGGTGGTTTWNVTNTATGGSGGSANTVGPVSTGGSGGTGTFTGGTGGVGGTITAANIVAGGGGGGSAGVNGNGANGGTGNTAVANADGSAGGGGGNGGGSSGGNGVSGASGSGGNNSLGLGGGASASNANGNLGVRGGGGSGGEGAGFRGGIGGSGADILNGFGSGGGSGGSTNLGNGAATPGLYGAGGGGAGAISTAFNGAAGAQGAIILVYTLVSGDITVDVTGVQASGEVGTESVIGKANTNVTGVQASGEVGTVSVAQPIDVNVTGVEATGAVGSVDVSIPTQVSITGVEATGAVGTVAVNSDANIAVTGVLGTTELGDVTVATGVPVNVNVTGVSASGEVGTVVVTAVQNQNVSVTGVSATNSVGTVQVSGKANTNVTGVQASGEVGTVSVAQPIDVNVTGVEATGAVGSAAVNTDANIAVTGVEATGAVGTVSVTAKANVSVIGVEATGAVGNVAVTGIANILVTGVQATGAIGNVVVSIPKIVTVTGVQATTALGVVSLNTTNRISVSGVQATGYVGTVLVWGLIPDNQDPNWQIIDDSQAGIWTVINDAQTPNWTDIAA